MMTRTSPFGTGICEVLFVSVRVNPMYDGPPSVLVANAQYIDTPPVTTSAIKARAAKVVLTARRDLRFN